MSKQGGVREKMCLPTLALLPEIELAELIWKLVGKGAIHWHYPLSQSTEEIQKMNLWCRKVKNSHIA